MGTRSEISFPLLRAVHPGEVLKEELKERGIKQKDFARAIGMQASHLSELIKGRRAFTPAFTDKVEAELGIASVELMNMQTQYDYDVRHIAHHSLEHAGDIDLNTGNLKQLQAALYDLSNRIRAVADMI